MYQNYIICFFIFALLICCALFPLVEAIRRAVHEPQRDRFNMIILSGLSFALLLLFFVET